MNKKLDRIQLNRYTAAFIRAKSVMMVPGMLWNVLIAILQHLGSLD